MRQGGPRWLSHVTTVHERLPEPAKGTWPAWVAVRVGAVSSRDSPPQVQPRTVAIPDDLQLSFENLLSHK